MKLKLTTAGRVVLFVIIIAILCVAGFFGYRYIEEHKPDLIPSFGSDTLDSTIGTSDTDNKTSNTPAVNKTDTADPTINLSLDEWIGWKPIIDANGGLTTQPGSIFDKLGITVNINIINDVFHTKR